MILQITFIFYIPKWRWNTKPFCIFTGFTSQGTDITEERRWSVSLARCQVYDWGPYSKKCCCQKGQKKFISHLNFCVYYTQSDGEIHTSGGAGLDNEGYAVARWAKWNLCTIVLSLGCWYLLSDLSVWFPGRSKDSFILYFRGKW